MYQQCCASKYFELHAPVQVTFLAKIEHWRKNGQKCLKKPENQQNGAQKNLNSGLYLKILMPGLSVTINFQDYLRSWEACFEIQWY